MRLIGLAVVLALPFALAPAVAEAQPATWPSFDYRFGMTKEEVRRVKSCGPYEDVPVTGDLECSNFAFRGQNMTLSFHFRKVGADRGLHKITLQFYQGPDRAKAQAAVDDLLDSMRGQFGELESCDVGLTIAVTRDRLFQALTRRSEALVTRDRPANVYVFPQNGSWTHSVGGLVSRMAPSSYHIAVIYSEGVPGWEEKWAYCIESAPAPSTIFHRSTADHTQIVDVTGIKKIVVFASKEAIVTRTQGMTATIKTRMTYQIMNYRGPRDTAGIRDVTPREMEFEVIPAGETLFLSSREWSTFHHFSLFDSVELQVPEGIVVESETRTP